VKISAKEDKCRLHGKVKYLYSKIAEAGLCPQCVTAGFYRGNITADMFAQYPEIKPQLKKG